MCKTTYLFNENISSPTLWCTSSYNISTLESWLIDAAKVNIQFMHGGRCVNSSFLVDFLGEMLVIGWLKNIFQQTVCVQVSNYFSLDLYLNHKIRVD